MASPFSKKSVYHSELVKESPVVCRVKTEPQKSKFKGQGHYAVIICDGEEHTLQLENDSCIEAMTGLKGHEVELTATGREDEAGIEVNALGDAPAREPAPARTPARPAAQQKPAPAPAKPAAPAKTPEQHVSEFKRRAGRAANALIIAYGAALYVSHQLKEQRGYECSPDETQANASKIFIALDRGGNFDSLPTVPPDIRPKQPAPSQPEN